MLRKNGSPIELGHIGVPAFLVVDWFYYRFVIVSKVVFEEDHELEFCTWILENVLGSVTEKTESDSGVRSNLLIGGT